VEPQRTEKKGTDALAAASLPPTAEMPTTTSETARLKIRPYTPRTLSKPAEAPDIPLKHRPQKREQNSFSVSCGLELRRSISTDSETSCEGLYMET
jgi:hypothetical protein